MKSLIRITGFLTATFLISLSNPKRATHTLSFVGSTFSASDVSDEAQWQEISPILCDGPHEVACHVVVPPDDYVVFNSNLGVTILDVNKVDLGAQIGYTSSTFINQYQPFKQAGTDI